MSRRGAKSQRVVQSCVAQHLRGGAGIDLMDARGIAPDQSREDFLTRMLFASHPELAQVAACLTLHGVVPKHVHGEMGAKLLFLAITHFGTITVELPESQHMLTDSQAQYAWIESLVRAGPPFNFTLGGYGTGVDDFNILHHLADRDRIAFTDLVNMLLRSGGGEDGHLANYISAVTEDLAGGLSMEHAQRLRTAVRQLLDVTVSTRMPPPRLLGRTVRAGPITELHRAMSQVIAVRLLPFIMSLSGGAAGAGG